MTPKRAKKYQWGRYNSIPTLYNGCRYRSMTEARWALFFDTLGIRHWYEPRKFNFGSYRYIPDFYLPELHAWAEIKGPGPTDEQVIKIKRLAEMTGERAFLFFGLVASADTDGNYAYGYVWRNPNTDACELYGDHLFAWTRCPRCEQIDVAHLGRVCHLPCRCLRKAKEYGDEDPILLAAFQASVQAFKGQE